MHLRLLLLAALAVPAFAVPPEPKFLPVTLDDKVQIGYGVAVADVDGDKLPDVLLADKKQFAWYKNPGVEKAHDPATWTRYVLAENLTTNDNVCIAAQDIDGDGKCEIAVGAEWNPGDTVNSGAVFYLIPPADRTQKWEPVKFPSVEPTTHRMRWIRVSEKEWGLVVAPLHGRGNKNGEGDPVKILLYHPPTKITDTKAEWKSELLDGSMHMTHNFDLFQGKQDGVAGGFLAGKEGVFGLRMVQGKWASSDAGMKNLNAEGYRGAGEVRTMHTAKELAASNLAIVTIEPMHGNQLAVYRTPQTPGDSHRRVLTDKLTEGHALRCGDLLESGSDQIVVGWRGTPGKEGSTIGVHLWTPLDEKAEQWRDSSIDDSGMACEDLTLADLDGDGKLDIVASGRATHNLKVYYNQTTR